MTNTDLAALIVSRMQSEMTEDFPQCVKQRFEIVCTANSRPSVHSNRSPKGAQWWARDIYHIQAKAAPGKTLCGRNSSEYLRLTGAEFDVDGNCCVRCRNAIAAILGEGKP
jgi:hypothetical protein